MITWHLFEKVYRVWVVFAVGEPDDFYRFMEECGYNDMENLKLSATSGYCIQLNDTNNDRGNYCFVVWLEKYETACLVHELAHLVMFIFGDKGVPVREENSEAFSYYQEFWFNEITRTRRRLPKGRSAAEARHNG